MIVPPLGSETDPVDIIKRALDINVTLVHVPRQGKTEAGDTIPRIVLDPDGNELRWVTRALVSAQHTGTSNNTVRAYAKAFLRVARFLWAIDVDPGEINLVHYVLIRGWLRYQLRITTPVPDSAVRPLKASTLVQSDSALIKIYDHAALHGLVRSNPVRQWRLGLSDIKQADAVIDTQLAAPNHTPAFDSGYSGPQSGGNKGGRAIAKVQQQPVRTLPRDVQEGLRNAHRLRDRALWTLCLDGGPRASEALSLTPERYFPNDGYADVVGKGLDGATRPIPVTDEAAVAIDDYLRELANNGWRPAAEDQIFRSVYRPYPPLSYMGLWKALRRALGDPNVHPHALRHTAATETLALFTDRGDQGLLWVQQMLGHKHLATTQRYLHSTPQKSISEVVRARRAPRPSSTPILQEVYGQASLDLLAIIRKEAS